MNKITVKKKKKNRKHLPCLISDRIFSTTNNMNFWQRLINFAFIFYSRWVVLPGVFTVHDSLARKYFGPGCPSTQSIIQNRSLLISSSLWLFQYPRPVFPNTVFVGPLHLPESTRPLSDVSLIQTFLSIYTPIYITYLYIYFF